MRKRQEWERMYRPLLDQSVQKGYGYAVFSNTGIKILLGGSGRDQGVAVNNETKKEIFMNMFEIQAGLGMGVKKFRVVFVFNNQKVRSSTTS